MRTFLVKSFIPVVSLIALASTGLTPAQANDDDLISGGKPPASWIGGADSYYAQFPSLTLNAPQGRIVADSGFRPYPNGFPVPNWGSPLDFVNTQVTYGLPTRLTVEQAQAGRFSPPERMNALSLRRTFGDGVCRDPQDIDPKTGDCQLIFGADLLSRMVATSAQGGHCFGLAAAAAALYNGQIPASQVGASGLGINATNQMRQPATQTIERLFGTQYFNPDMMRSAFAGMSPTDLVNTLIADFADGTAPYILGIINGEGGHAITPYAVLDRGNGLFDIAVYDNNFPLRPRAVTVDTNTDSFAYTSAINPAAPGIEWNTETGGRIGLISVAETLKTQRCPVCLGPDQGTLLAFSSLTESNADEIVIGLLDEQGDPLSSDLFRSVAALNPPTDGVESQRVIFIEPGVKFGVLVQTGNLVAKEAMEIFAISNGKAQYVLLDELVSNSNTLFGVGGLEGALFTSSAPSSPRILQLSDQVGASFDVNGHPLRLPAGVEVTQRWNTETERVIYASDARKTLRWNIQIGGLDDNGGREYVGLNVRVPAGGRIVVDYTNASDSIAPNAWVRNADGVRTPITMQPVTEQLINDYRDELYLTQGPG